MRVSLVRAIELRQQIQRSRGLPGADDLARQFGIGRSTIYDVCQRL